ncbi:hypothetical protein [Singulisphaera sp. PoT]
MRLAVGIIHRELALLDVAQEQGGGLGQRDLFEHGILLARFYAVASGP